MYIHKFSLFLSIYVEKRFEPDKHRPVAGVYLAVRTYACIRMSASTLLITRQYVC